MNNFDYKKYLMENRINTSEELDVNEEAPSSKTTVSALKAEIKEMILASMNEGEDGHVGGNTDADFEREAAMQMSMREEEEEDIELEDEAEMDAEESPVEEPAQSVGFTPEEEAIQTSLKTAYDSATAMGDEKLAAQIGNSITFFTRTHVVER